MIVKIIGFCALVQLVVSQMPITFKDGKIGVNFGGYHAEAGLGGLLTGNAAHGGLTASAGTPYGQSAQAGLGGNTGPNMRGGLFAGATAGEGIGASASLAGDLNNPAGGSLGVGEATAYAGGVQKSVIKTVSTNFDSNAQSNVGTPVEVAPIVVEPSYLPPLSGQTATVTVAQSEQTVNTPEEAIETPETNESYENHENHGNPENHENHENHGNPENHENHGSVVEKFEQSNIPVYSEQIEPSTQSVVVEIASTSTTTSAPEITIASGPAPPAPYPSSSSFDADDNDLTDNKAPQVATVAQTVTQVASQPAVNVQKIKVRPQPVLVQPTYTVVEKRVQVPVVTKTVTYQQPILKQVIQYPIPALKPLVLRKHIQYTAPYPQVIQQVEVETTEQGPTTTTTTTSTTPRPFYNYTYDKNQIINEILSIPFHAIRAVSEVINAKLAGGYSVQKSISYI